MSRDMMANHHEAACEASNNQATEVGEFAGRAHHRIVCVSLESNLSLLLLLIYYSYYNYYYVMSLVSLMLDAAAIDSFFLIHSIGR